MNYEIIDKNIERIGYDFYCDIAINIANKRTQLGLTQEELALKTGIKLSRLRNLENVHYRISLEEIKKISSVLDVTVNNLINAELDSQVGECLYTLCLEEAKDFKLYQYATSKRMAFLELESRLNKKGCTWFSGPRVRVYVKLIGKPITDQELKDKLPKYKENQEIEK